MAFDEIKINDGISYGSRGGPGFDTRIIELDSGAEERISRREVARHSYDIGYGIRDDRKYEDLALIKAFYLARKGAKNGWRFKDWQDYASTTTNTAHLNDDDLVDDEDQTLGVGDATETAFQLTKTYSDTIQDHVRNITKPVSGTVVVALDGVAQTITTDFTVDTTTGIVTFGTAPGVGVVVTAGFEYDVPVRFGEAADAILQVDLVEFEGGRYPNIPIIELIDELEVQDRFYFGGTYDHGDVTTDVSITLGLGRVHIVKPTTSGVAAVLQRADDIPPGGPIFYIVNDGTSSMDVENETGTNVITLAVDEIAEILISIDSSNAKSYVAK